jgi:small subunit ribosomal protein S7
MSRKHKAETREVLPDPKFGDTLITKFINCMMYDGKKSTAEAIFYGALSIVEQKSGEEGLKVFKKAMNNVKPAVEVRRCYISSANRSSSEP